MKLQTYENVEVWKSGNKLKLDKIVDKIYAHDFDLLHLSSHLLIIDSQGMICCRKRPANDFRYAGLWTTTIGTHVPLKQDHRQTLAPLLPIKMETKWVGEFKVHDRWENEIYGLYTAFINRQGLPDEFMRDRTFLSSEKLKELISRHKTTPHLAEAYKLLVK